MMDKISDSSQRHEPSSPVPLLMGRAKRLVSLSFMEILKDMAPGGLSQASTIGGTLTVVWDGTGDSGSLEPDGQQQRSVCRGVGGRGNEILSGAGSLSCEKAYEALIDAGAVDGGSPDGERNGSSAK